MTAGAVWVRVLAKAELPSAQLALMFDQVAGYVTAIATRVSGGPKLPPPILAGNQTKPNRTRRTEPNKTTRRRRRRRRRIRSRRTRRRKKTHPTRPSTATSN